MSEADLTGAIYLFNQSKEKTMALIQTVEPDRAEGKVKEIYDFMQKNAGVIPAPCSWQAQAPRCWLWFGNRFSIILNIRIWDSGYFPVYVIWWPSNTITLSAPISIGIC